MASPSDHFRYGFKTLKKLYRYVEDFINTQIPYSDTNYHYFGEYSYVNHRYFGGYSGGYYGITYFEGKIRIMRELKNSCTVYPQIYKSFDMEIFKTKRNTFDLLIFGEF